MMPSAASVAPFPWARLPRVSRQALAARRDLIDRALRAVDPSRVNAALQDLLGDDAQLGAAELVERSPEERAARGTLEGVAIDFPGHGLHVFVRPEPELWRACVARLLEQEFELGWADTGIDAALRGAGAALVLEVARRVSRAEAPSLSNDADVRGAHALEGALTLRLGEKPYRCDLSVEISAPGRGAAVRPPPRLAQLGAARVAVPWVAAVSCAPVQALEQLEPGDVWIPGAQSWVAAELGANGGVLAPPNTSCGIPIRVVSGRTVLGAQLVGLPEEAEVSMSQNTGDLDSLEDIVGQTPLVVRLELGVLELSAAEWAALRPGDVVQSGRRIADPVVLRAAGQEIARGELVDIEGEIGVRITHVGAARGGP